MRAIAADALIKRLAYCVRQGMGATIAYTFMHIIDEQPSIDIEPKRGEWLRTFDGNEWFWYCSKCKAQWYEEDLWMGGNEFPNFCPNCGADMREREGE